MLVALHGLLLLLPQDHGRDRRVGSAPRRLAMMAVKLRQQRRDIKQRLNRKVTAVETPMKAAMEAQ